MGVRVDELAVEAVADAHGGLHRLDVNVGGAHAEGFGERLQNKPDDRRVVAFVARLAVARGDLETVIAGGTDRRATIELAQMFLDVIAGGADQVQLAADDVRQCVECFEVERIRDGYGERQAFILDRDHPVAVRSFIGNGLGDGGIECHIAEAQERDAGIGRKCLGDVLLSERGIGEQVLDDRLGSRERAARLGQVVGAHHSGFGEQFCEIIFVGEHWAWSPGKSCGGTAASDFALAASREGWASHPAVVNRPHGGKSAFSNAAATM